MPVPDATFAVPYSACKPRSLVIKPTVGTFANSNTSSLLHVGITDSQGATVYNFDIQGRKADKASSTWPEALSVPLTAGSKQLSDAEWDSALLAFFLEEKEMNRVSPYHALQNNCYSFAIRFLNSIQYHGSSTRTKEQFVLEAIADPVAGTVPT